MTHGVDSQYCLVKKEWNVYPLAPPMSRISVETNLLSHKQFDQLYDTISKEVACIATEKKVHE